LLTSGDGLSGGGSGTRTCGVLEILTVGEAPVRLARRQAARSVVLLTFDKTRVSIVDIRQDN
jgi:hypothetical protein